MGTNNINSFGEVLLWSFWIFIWIAAIMIWFRCVFDMFSDRTLSGWGKAGWAIVLIFVPWLGALIYLIARGRAWASARWQAVADAQVAAGEVHQVGRGRLGQPGGADHPRQVPARLRRHHPGGVRLPQGEGSRLT